MGKRRKALESSLELVEDQQFQDVEATKSYHRLASTLRDQLVSGECLALLDGLAEEIQAWACYSDYIYRNPAEWDTYMDEREKAALERLVGRG